MDEVTKQILIDAQRYCDEEDKSTEFMLQYMADMANVDMDVVIEFLTNNDEWKQTK